MEDAQNLGHTTVLQCEAVDSLLGGGTQGVFVDATFGAGGHSRMLLERLPEDARVLAMDCDEMTVGCARAITDQRFSFLRANFADLLSILHDQNIPHVQGILFDLGVSSMQLDDPVRGFSFRYDAGLDMRMDQRCTMTATSWLRHASYKQIYGVLRTYGQEPESRALARVLFACRERLNTTSMLSDTVCRAKKKHKPGRHSATLVFQALRMVVNEEIETLKRGLQAACHCLAAGGRLVVIAFHSVEDSVVKHFFAGDTFPGMGRLHAQPMRPIGKAIRPTASEVAINPRARSACMRVFAREGRA